VSEVSPRHLKFQRLLKKYDFVVVVVVVVVGDLDFPLKNADWYFSNAE
jgi:hypothetical protein